MFCVAIRVDADGFKKPIPLFLTVLTLGRPSCSQDSAVLVLTVQALPVLGNVFGFEPDAQEGEFL